jgi:Acetoacetate decarboxylase (ADC)
MLSIDFLTAPEIVRVILPPGLESAAEPLITAMVGRCRSNCVADFTGGAIYVAARHGDIGAPYVLAMFMDTDQRRPCWTAHLYRNRTDRITR